MITAPSQDDASYRYSDATAIAAAQQHRIAEVEVAGVITAAPKFFFGRHTHAWHEEFPIVTEHGLHLDIIDNIQLAPPIPVTAGDEVIVKGQFVPRGAGGIVHDTHHCAGSKWHEGGWIAWHGRTYQ